MQVISYTHEALVMLLRELGIRLTKPTMHLLAWMILALLEKTPAHLFRLERNCLMMTLRIWLDDKRSAGSYLIHAYSPISSSVLL